MFRQLPETVNELCHYAIDMAEKVQHDERFMQRCHHLGKDVFAAAKAFIYLTIDFEYTGWDWWDKQRLITAIRELEAAFKRWYPDPEGYAVGTLIHVRLQLIQN